MMRVDGPSFDDLDPQIEAMDALVQSIAGRIFDEVASTLGDVRVAAAPPEEIEQSGEPSVSLDSLAVIVTLWATAVTAEIIPAIRNIFYLSLQKTRNAIFGKLAPDRADNLPDVDSDIARSLAEEYLATAPNRMSGFGDDMWSVARAQLLDGFMKGESIEKLRDRLRQSVGLTAGRASLVARTEVISASNAGSLSMIEIAGFGGTKSWLATEDLRTRPTHIEADGQTVAIDAAFTVGGFPLFFPGDPAAPPEEICNCRCTLTYDLDDEPLTATGADVEDETVITEPVTAAAYVLTIPDVPPPGWFDEPTDVDITGGLTVTDEGRVYGYLAPAGVAHRGFKERITAPMGNVDYSGYMGRETIVAGGGRVVTGALTMDCGHASLGYRDPGAAMDHYDNTCSIVATVRIGENRDGVWVAGALVPGLTASQVTRMMASQLSGDWRPHRDRSGWREFAGALLVPVPGFPMARTEPSVEVEESELVASSVPVNFVTSDAECGCTAPVDMAPELEVLAASVGLDLSSRMNSLRESVMRG